MKKALQISLARTLFTVEEDAYARLDAYLASIRALFAQEGAKDDIIADVEGRIAEKFLESKKAIIDIDEVEKVIAAMGEASDYRENGASEAGTKAGASEEPPSAAYAAKKKFYRDPKDAILGGVCSGIAAYFGVDVLWIRLGFVIAAFANGISVIAYLIIWLITPEARTASQRLEMEGTPVTLGTLKETASEAIEEVKRRDGGRAQQIVETTANMTGRILRDIFGAIGTILRVVVGTVLLVASAAGVLALSVAIPFFASNPSASWFAFPLTDAMPLALIWAAAAAIYLIIVLPGIVILLLALGMLLKRSILNGVAVGVIAAAWTIALIVGAASAAHIVPAVSEHIRTAPEFAEVTRTMPVDAAPFDAIVVADGIRLTLVQGPVASLELAGRTDMVDRAKAEIENGTLTLRTDYERHFCFFCEYGAIEATLVVPDLTKATARRGSRITAEKWIATKPVEFAAEQGSRLVLDLTAPEARITATQGVRASIAGDIAMLFLDATQGSVIDLTANGDSATLNASMGSRIDAELADYKAVTGAVRQGSHVDLGEPETADMRESEGSSIDYLRAPEEPKEPEVPQAPGAPEQE